MSFISCLFGCYSGCIYISWSTFDLYSDHIGKRDGGEMALNWNAYVSIIYLNKSSLSNAHIPSTAPVAVNVNLTQTQTETSINQGQELLFIDHTYCAAVIYHLCHHSYVRESEIVLFVCLQQPDVSSTATRQ